MSPATEDLKTHPSLPSANNAATLQECTNILKGVNCNPPPSLTTALIPPTPREDAFSSTSKELSTSLSTAPVLQAASVSHLFQPPRQQLAHHQQSLAHLVTTSGFSVPLTMEQPVSVTHACVPHSGSSYAARMLDIYRVETAHGQPNFRGRKYCWLPISSSMNGKLLLILRWIVRSFSI